MAYVTPNSFIQIFSGVPLNRDSEDTLRFSSRSAQDTYFAGLSGILFDLSAYSYVRGTERGGVVRIEVSSALKWADVYKTNYMRFKNASHEDKWFYAFVTDVQYIAEAIAEITYELDPMQTYLPGVDYTLTECYVERETPLVDEIGSNVQPENISNVKTNFWKNSLFDPYYTNDTTPNFYFAILVENSGTANINISPLSGSQRVISRCYIDAALLLFDANDSTEMSNMKQLLSGTGSHAGIDPKYILTIYTIPKIFIDANDIVSGYYSIGVGSSIWFTCSTIADGATAQSSVWTPIVSLDTLPDGTQEGYTPQNKKLFTYPFCYYDVLNAEGNSLKLRYEELKTPGTGSEITHRPTFKIMGSLIPPCKVVAMARYYQDTDNSTDAVSSLPPIPTGIFNTDAYKEGIQRTMASLVALAGGAIATGLTGGAFAGAVPGVAGALSGALGQGESPQYSGSYSDATTAFSNAFLKFEGRQEYPENFKEIDHYFTAYGYTINDIKVPIVDGRSRFVYTKTARARFISINTPAEAMKAIQARFDQGVRFWRTPSSIGDLTSENAIL